MKANALRRPPTAPDPLKVLMQVRGSRSTQDPHRYGPGTPNAGGMAVVGLEERQRRNPRLESRGSTLAKCSNHEAGRRSPILRYAFVGLSGVSMPSRVSS